MLEANFSYIFLFFIEPCQIADVSSLNNVIQDLLKLERLQEELAERCGAQPTFVQWAAAAGVDQKTLRKRLNYGILCKDKMIKSNIRLVISIAKNYQGVGMDLQDLVQVCVTLCTAKQVDMIPKEIIDYVRKRKEKRISQNLLTSMLVISETCFFTPRKDAEAL